MNETKINSGKISHLLKEGKKKKDGEKRFCKASLGQVKKEEKKIYIYIYPSVE